MSADARIPDPTARIGLEVFCWRCSKPLTLGQVPLHRPPPKRISEHLLGHEDCREDDGSLLISFDYENIEER